MECTSRKKIPSLHKDIKEEYQDPLDIVTTSTYDLEAVKKEESNKGSENDNESDSDSDEEVIYYIAVDDDDDDDDDDDKEEEEEDDSEIDNSDVEEFDLKDEAEDEGATTADIRPKRPRQTKEDRTRVDCEKCGKVCTTRNALLRHLKLKHFFGKFKCTKCDRGFVASYADHFVDHHDKHHPKSKLKCPKCGKQHDDRKGFTSHYATHSMRKTKSHESYVCDLCGKAIKGKYVLRDHMNVHAGLKPYKCTECDFSSPHSAGLSAHRTMHKREKGIVSHMCEICGKSFSTATYVREHKLIIHEGKTLHHECGVCSKRFTNISTLCRHRAKFHRADDATTCKVCGYVASFRNELRKHEKSHQEGEFPCRFCGKVLKTKYSVAAHERLHTGESPYTCKTCDFRCKSSAALWKHRVDKHEERQRVVPKKVLHCHVCGKEFGSRDSLNGHMNGHTGNKPYNCDECDYASTHRAGLFMHKKKHARLSGVPSSL